MDDAAQAASSRASDAGSALAATASADKSRLPTAKDPAVKAGSDQAQAGPDTTCAGPIAPTCSDSSCADPASSTGEQYACQQSPELLCAFSIWQEVCLLGCQSLAVTMLG